MNSDNEEKYCPACEKIFKDLPSRYQFCPECGSELKEGLYSRILNKITKENHEPHTRKYCKNCDMEFKTSYNFCPLCSNELEEDELFSINMQKEVVIGKWNDGTIEIPFDEILGNDSSWIEPFNKKAILDKKYEEDKIIFELGNIHGKLTYEHVIESINVIENHFLNSLNEKCGETLEENFENLEYHFYIVIPTFLYLYDKIDKHRVGKLNYSDELYLFFDTAENIDLKREHI